MEIITTAKDFSQEIKYHRISPDTCIRVIIDNVGMKTGSERILLPIITHEEQKQILNLMPKEYEPESSEELIRIIAESHMNTNTPDL